MPETPNLSKVTGFDPFESRLCRTVRNELSEGLVAALQHVDVGVPDAIAAEYLQPDTPPLVKQYAEQRILRYHAVLNQIQNSRLEATRTLDIAVLLWNQGLFFEVHEWLEHQWHQAQGSQKALLQALIRAAGAYHHLEYGRLVGAEKLAAKAVAGLTRNKEMLPASFNIDPLIAKLDPFDPVPPKL